MRRGFQLLGLLSVCGCLKFTPSVAPAEDAGMDLDGPTEDAALDASQLEAGAEVACPAVPDLRACYTFDGDTMDRSTYGNNPTVVTNVSFVAVGAEGFAVVTNSANIAVPDTASFDLPVMTIRATVRPTSFPAGANRAAIIDSRSFRMFVLANGQVRCALNSSGTPEVVTSASLQLDVYTRVTCIYDGAVMRVHFDGTQVGSTSLVGPIEANTAFVTIGQGEPGGNGENLLGAIDKLEIWGSVQTP